MMYRMDWSADIIPGRSMMGLLIGAPYNDVLTSLKLCACDAIKPSIIKFKDSPVL